MPKVAKFKAATTEQGNTSMLASANLSAPNRSTFLPPMMNRPNNACWHCGAWHFSDFHEYDDHGKLGHKETMCQYQDPRQPRLTTRSRNRSRRSASLIFSKTAKIIKHRGSTLRFASRSNSPNYRWTRYVNQHSLGNLNTRLQIRHTIMMCIVGSP